MLVRRTIRTDAAVRTLDGRVVWVAEAAGLGFRRDQEAARGCRTVLVVRLRCHTAPEAGRKNSCQNYGQGAAVEAHVARVPATACRRCAPINPGAEAGTRSASARCRNHTNLDLRGK